MIESREITKLDPAVVDNPKYSLYVAKHMSYLLEKALNLVKYEMPDHFISIEIFRDHDVIRIITRIGNDAEIKEGCDEFNRKLKAEGKII